MGQRDVTGRDGRLIGTALAFVDVILKLVVEPLPLFPVEAVDRELQQIILQGFLLIGLVRTSVSPAEKRYFNRLNFNTLQIKSARDSL